MVQIGLDRFENGFLAMQEMYKEVLIWALAQPKKVIAIALASLMISGLLLPFIGTEFQPTYDSGEFSIMMTAPAGTSFEKMQGLVLPIEEQVLTIPELESAVLTVGPGNQSNKATIGIKLVGTNKRSRSMDKIMEDMRAKVRDFGNLKIAVQNSQGMGRGDARPVQIALRGPDLAVLTHTAQELANKIKQIPGTADVDISSEQSSPEVQILLNSARVSDAGLDAGVVSNTVQSAFLGINTRNKYNAGDRDYNIKIRLKADDRKNIEDVANLQIAGKAGQFIRLGDIAESKLSSGPAEIDRDMRQREVIVYSNVVGVSSGDVIAKVKNMMPEMNLPLGYSYKFVGQAQTMQDSFAEIGKSLGLAVILIYMVLAAQFESFIHPLTIMLSLPFSLIGAILGLLISGQTMNIMSLIGVIMLMGLVTKNGILLVDYANQLRERGKGISEALIEAGSVRLRPILMTTAAMIFGMMPIALGIGAGAELRQSMGVVLVGGLITSTLLTLVVIPAVYLLVDKMKKNLRHKTDTM